MPTPLVTFERSVWKSSELATVGCALVAGGVTTYKAIEMFGQQATLPVSGCLGLTGLIVTSAAVGIVWVWRHKPKTTALDARYGRPAVDQRAEINALIDDC